jgi:uncharacterized membrane protein YfcA
VAGTVGYVVTGWNGSGLPPGSFGYLYWPALAGLAIGGMLTAPLGAKAAHSLPTKRLKQAFALLLYILATRMLVALA